MDWTAKVLLAAIAAGLWANTAATIIRPASADTETWLGRLTNEVQSMNQDFHSFITGDVGCRNSRICPTQ